MINKPEVPMQPLKTVILRLLTTQWFTVSLILILVVTISSFLGGRSQLVSQQQTTALLGVSAGQYYEDAAHMIEILAKTVPTQSDLDVIQRTASAFNAIYAIAMDGELMVITPQDHQLKPGMDMSGHPNFGLESPSTHVSKPFISARTGKPTVYISTALPAGRGNLVGELSLADLDASLHGTDNENIANYYITDASGTFLAHADERLVNQQEKYINAALISQLKGQRLQKIINRDGRLIITIMERVPQTNWVAITEVSFRQVYGSFFIPAFGGLWIIALLYLWIVRRERNILTQRVIEPLNQIDEAARVLSEGNYEVEIQLSSDATYFEVATLADSFERMRNAIRNNTRALRESEEKYRTVANYTYDWEAWRTPDGKYRYVSPSCKTITGYTAEEFLADPELTLKIILPEDRPRYQSHLDEFAMTENANSEHLDFRIKTKQGDIRWISHFCVIVFNEEGEFIGRRESNRDITDSVAYEFELRRWGHIFAQAEWGIIVHPENSVIPELMNPAFARMHGYSLVEMKNIPITEYFAPEFREKISENMILAHQKGHHVWEAKHLHKDGHTFPVNIDATTVKNERGEIQYCVVNVQDITEKQRTEEALRASETKFSTAFRISPDSININRMVDGTYLDINEGFIQMTGYTTEEVIGRSSLELDIWVNPEDRKKLVKGLMESGVVNNLEAPFRAKNGDIKVCLMSAKLIEIDGEKCILSITRDISERKLIEEKIRSLNEELELRVTDRTAQLVAANKELEAFSYSVSHDLRAPLRGIDGWSLALLEEYGEKLDEQGRQYLDRVRSEIQRMGQLIDGLLLLSRVTRMETKSAEINLSEMAESVVDRLKEDYSHQEYVTNIQPGLETVGDFNLIHIVLTNLLENAFKFSSKTSKPVIEFGCQVENGENAFYIRDNGAGFDMQYAGNLFGAFQRMHRQTDFPGTGVGLATVQRIIHRHGGKVWAKSALNDGTTFYFTLGENK
jgi:PAS domain S-box-containing protein